MKKLLSLLFAATLVLAACGGDKEKSSDDSSKDSSEKTSESKKNTDSVSVDKDSEEKKSDTKFKDDKLTSKNFDLEILETHIVKPSKYESDDNPSIAIVFGVKNKSDKELTASSAFSKTFDVYQNSKDVKKSLRGGGGYDSDLYKKYGEDTTNEINKDGQVKGVEFFKLKDTKTPVTLQVKDPEEYSNDNLAKKEIKIEQK